MKKQPQSIKSTTYKSGGFYTLDRAGQQSPSGGDRFKIQTTYYLPQNKTGWRLLEELSFGSRLSINGSSLNSSWGGPSVKYPGYMEQTERDGQWDTWSEAFEESAKWAGDQFERLDTIIATRAQKRIDAEG